MVIEKLIATTESFQELDDKASTLIDLFKPLDGKNIEDIDDESSAALSSCSLKVLQVTLY